MAKPAIYDDYAMLTFPLSEPFELEEVMHMLEDDMELIILYHHVLSRQTRFGHSTYAYANPAFGRMFKINAKADDGGLVYQGFHFKDYELVSQKYQYLHADFLWNILGSRYNRHGSAEQPPRLGDNMLSQSAGLTITIGKSGWKRAMDASPYIRQNEWLMQHANSLRETNHNLSNQHDKDARALAGLKKILEIEGLLDTYGEYFLTEDDMTLLRRRSVLQR